jgi:hypothetical protein
MTAPRTAYDEVREKRDEMRSDVGWNEKFMTAPQWRERRDGCEGAVIENRLGAHPMPGRERGSLILIAALAIAQIEALDRRSAPEAGP